MCMCMIKCGRCERGKEKPIFRIRKNSETDERKWLDAYINDDGVQYG